MRRVCCSSWPAVPVSSGSSPPTNISSKDAYKGEGFEERGWLQKRTCKKQWLRMLRVREMFTGQCKRCSTSNQRYELPNAKRKRFLYLLRPFPSSSHISNTLILCPVTPAVLLHPHVFRTSYLCCNGVDEILDCLAVNSHLVLIIQSTKIIERSVAHIMVSQKIRQFS